MTIDWNKPLRTKEYKYSVRLLGKLNCERGDPYIYVCAVSDLEGRESIEISTEKGVTSYRYLENVPEEQTKLEGYIALSPEFLALRFSNLYEAEYQIKQLGLLNPPIIDLSTLKPKNFVRSEE